VERGRNPKSMLCDDSLETELSLHEGFLGAGMIVLDTLRRVVLKLRIWLPSWCPGFGTPRTAEMRPSP